MKIIISNQEFDYDFGCKLLKLKYDKCPIKNLEDIWDDIIPATFEEIAQLSNIEARRVAINCFGITRLTETIKPKLIDKKTINKTTVFIDKKGQLKEKKFRDTYELYEVSSKYLNPKGLSKSTSYNLLDDAYFVKCKDTSTKREYMIWVEPQSIYRTNISEGYYRKISDINAIQAIAWTITTNIPEGSIEKIVRQGDCVLIKPKQPIQKLTRVRHLTEKEYRNLMVAES